MIDLPSINWPAEEAEALAVALSRPGVDADEAETVELVLGSVRRWARRHLDGLAVDAAGEVQPDLYRSAAELGLFGLTIPRRFGGAGLSLAATARVLEEIATFDRSVGTAIGLHCGLGLQGLIQFGAPKLQERYLPRMAAGRTVGAFAATEPGAGSHIAAVRSVARPNGGDGLILNGSKCYVTNGGLAGVYTVLARTPGLGGAKRGHSLLLVDRDAPGLGVGHEERKLGLRGTSTTTLAFDDVQLGTERVLGRPGQGLAQLAALLAWGRTLMAAGCVGSAREAYRRALQHVQEREQFGRPLAAFELVRRAVAEMRATIYQMESVVRLCALTHHRLGQEADWASATTKVLASELGWEVVDTALQLHGGAGYIEDSGLPLILRDCRITRIFEGANDVLRFDAAMRLVAGERRDVRRPPVAGRVHPALEEPARDHEQLLLRLADAVAAARRRHGLRIGEQQILLGRLADAAAWLYVQLAVLLRASGELRREEDLRDLLDLSRLALLGAGRRARGALDLAEARADEGLLRRVSQAAYAVDGSLPGGRR